MGSLDLARRAHALGYNRHRGGGHPPAPATPPCVRVRTHESFHTLHHALARLFAANVDVAVVRISNEAMPSTLQLPVKFVEHEVTQQGRKWTSLWSSFHAWTDQSILHHSDVQERPDEFQ